MNSTEPNTYSSKVVESQFQAMGGMFIYRAYPQANLTPTRVTELFKEAHNEVLRIQNKFTEFEPSVLTDINENAFTRPVLVDDETWELLILSRDFFQKSDGVFDISFAAYAKAWRLALKDGRTLSSEEKEELRKRVNFNDIILNENHRTIQFKHNYNQISFGGIGKGHAVDRAFAFLKENGVVNFSVNGSGDMRVHATKEAPRPWRIGIRNPFAKDPNQSAGMVQVRNGGISTSGSYIQFNKSDESGRDHHVLNFYEDETHPPPVSVTIISESSMESDVWATICLAVDTPRAYKIMVENNLYGIIINKEGKSLLSPKALEKFQ